MSADRWVVMTEVVDSLDGKVCPLMVRHRDIVAAHLGSSTDKQVTVYVRDLGWKPVTEDPETVRRLLDGGEKP